MYLSGKDRMFMNGGKPILSLEALGYNNSTWYQREGERIGGIHCLTFWFPGALLLTSLNVKH